MEMLKLFRSVLDQDPAPVVLCDLSHTILYMNPVAVKRYEKYGGAALLGKSLLNCHPKAAQEKIEKILSWFEESPDHNRIYEFRNDEENKDVYMVALRAEDGTLIGYYEKHEYRTRETGKLYDFG